MNLSWLLEICSSETSTQAGLGGHVGADVGSVVGAQDPVCLSTRKCSDWRGEGEWRVEQPNIRSRTFFLRLEKNSRNNDVEQEQTASILGKKYITCPSLNRKERQQQAHSWGLCARDTRVH